METSTKTAPDRRTIAGVTFVAVYVDDFQSALEFYTSKLGLEMDSEMGDAACYLKISDDVGLYLEGGNKPSVIDAKTTRASFGLTASSVSAAYKKLSEDGVRLVHAEGPQDMGGGQAWFQCYDPAGNIIEIVGLL